jgi:plasmid stability protein
MSNLYVRNLPADLHQLIKSSAAAQKQTMSVFAAALLKEALDARDLRSARLKLNTKLFRMPNQKPPR